MKPRFTANITLLFVLLISATAFSADSMDRGGRRGAVVRRPAAGREARGGHDDLKARLEEIEKGKEKEKGGLEKKLEKIGEVVPPGHDEGKKEGWKEGDKPPGLEKKDKVPPGLEKKSSPASEDKKSNSHLAREIKHRPRDWEKWDGERQEKWEGDIRKAREIILKRAMEKKLAEADSKRGFETLELLSMRGLTPDDSAYVVDKFIERGYRGQQFTDAFQLFNSGLGPDPVVRNGFGGDDVRTLVEQILAKIGGPAAVNLPGMDAPPEVVIGDTVPHAEPDGAPVTAPPPGFTTLIAIKDLRPVRSPKHGKMR